MKIQFDWDQYAALARQTVAEGCVLLKNEDAALPIQKGERVSVFGRIQLHYYKSGTGSGGMVNAPYTVGILDGLRGQKEISLNEELIGIYEEWVRQNPFDLGEGWAMEPWCQKEMPLSEELVKKAAAQSDLALIILGRSAGEDKDNSAQRGSYLLTEEEEQLLQMVCTQFERTAVILNVGNIIDMKWVDQYNPKAVLYVWQGGAEGGNGVADVLTGKVNPSGKLSDTIANDIQDYPSTAYFGDEKENVYTEDLYIGYRYFETFAREKVKYPFGFGLSYTRFSYEITSFEGISADKTSLESKDENVALSVQVKNEGSLAGQEVIQIYHCPPQGKLGKPARALLAYQKTKLLMPGETQILSFTINRKDFASYDDSGKTGHPYHYVLESGEYTVYAGTDVRSARPAGSFHVKETVSVEALQQVLVQKETFERMIPVAEEGQLKVSYEKAPVRTYDLAARIRQNRPEALGFQDDQGIRLSDVADGKAAMEQFLSQLTDEDLICLTRGEGMCSPKVTPGIASAFGGLTEKLKGFGIPAGGCADGPSGIRMDCGTRAMSLPNGTLIACTFHTGLIGRLFDLLGRELRKNEIDTILGPGLNLHRNPLNGRNFEYFSEDPYLTGTMAAAELQALAPYKVTGTIKHFACNNQEKQRHNSNSVVSERALRELYLKGFEIAVKEGGAYCIMTSYNPINGIWSAGNYDLLTTVLRKEWGFSGIVMTDWWAKMNEEGEPASTKNTTAMVRAQNDLYMVVSDSASNSAGDNLAEGLLADKICRGELVRSAANICQVLLRSQVMDRMLHGEDEWTVLNERETGEGTIQKKEGGVVGDMLVLDLSGVNTTKGNQVQYPLVIQAKGKYTLTMKLQSDAGELAQMPVSILMNNHHIITVTINGTGGQVITRTVPFEVINAIDNYLSLYFGESGVILKELRIDKI